MISTFALHPAAAKALIARAVVKLPAFQKAYRQGRICMGRGSTNAAILRELWGDAAPETGAYLAGMIAWQSACIASSDHPVAQVCLQRGERWLGDEIEFLHQFESGDIFIKGANAVDPTGRAAVLVGHPEGGGIGKPYGIIKALGIPIICPVGLEKLIPSCTEAAKGMGILNIGPHLGMRLGYLVLEGAQVVTEIESIEILYGLKAVAIAGGGMGGMEGSVMLAIESEDEARLEALIQDMKQLNRISPPQVKKRSCTDCADPCWMNVKR